MKSERILATATSIALVAALGATESRAATVAYEFAGPIIQVIDNTGGTVPVTVGTSTFSGRFTYDSTAAPTSMVGTSTFYPGLGLSAVIDGSIRYSDGTVSIGVTNDSIFSGDVFQLQGIAPAAESDLPPVESTSASFVLGHDSGGAIANEDLPAFLNLSSWESAVFFITGSDSAGIQYRVRGRVDALVAVPEPGSFVLVLAGLALATRRARP